MQTTIPYPPQDSVVVPKKRYTETPYDFPNPHVPFNEHYPPPNPISTRADAANYILRQ
jgi:hypothetical protein